MTEKQQVKAPLRAGAYLRISSDPDDTRAGVARQREDTTGVIADRGWLLATEYGDGGFFIDNDVSASKGVRPKWRELLALVKDGKLDAIAVWVQDRAWRMMEDLCEMAKFAEELEKTTGRQIPLGTTSGSRNDYDLYDIDGMYNMQISTAHTEKFIKEMRRNIRRASDQAANRGLQNGSPRPFGYQSGGATIKHKDNPGGDIDQRERDALIRVKDVLLNNEGTLYSQAKWLNEQGIQTSQGGRTRKRKKNDDSTAYVASGKWTMNSLKRVLTRPRNAGLRQHRDVILEGVTANWEPLWDRDTHEALVRKLHRGNPNGAGAKGGPTPIYLGTRLYVCGVCGQPKMNRTTDRAPMYRCTVRNTPGEKHVSRHGVKLDLYVTYVLIELLLRDGFIDGMIDQLHGDDAETARLLAERERIDDELEKVRAARKRATGPISVQAFIEEIDRLEADATRTDGELESLGRRSSLEVLKRKMREYHEPVDKAWERLPISERRDILAEVMTVTVDPLPHRTPRFEHGTRIDLTDDAALVVHRLAQLHAHGQLSGQDVHHKTHTETEWTYPE